VARDWAHRFPYLPQQSEANPLAPGAAGQLRCHLASKVPTDDCQQIDTSALPVRHTSRLRGPELAGRDARFGRDAAHAEWLYGFRLAIKTDRGSRLVRARSIVPAAFNERDVVNDLLEGGLPPCGLLLARDSPAKPSAPARPPRHRRAHPAGQGLASLHAGDLPEDHRRMAHPDRDDLQRNHRPDRTSPPRRAHLLGLLTRTATTIAGHTLMRVWLAGGPPGHGGVGGRDFAASRRTS
jgi:hypothetical protein